VGRNCNLELDWAPYMAGPQSGALPPDQISRFAELGQWIDSCYGDANRAAHASGNATVVPGSAHASTFVLPLPSQLGAAKGKQIDRVVIQEDQAYGQRILAWNVSTDKGFVVGSGKSIGNKRIVMWNSTLPDDSTQLVLNVLEAKALPVIRNFAAYHECPSQ